MDVNCFQNLMPVQPSASLASQSVSGKRTVQETNGFASKLENAVAAKQSVTEHNIRHDAAGDAKNDLDKMVQENGIIAANQAEELDENLHGRSDSQILEVLPDPKEISENISFVPQPLLQTDLPQPGIPVPGNANSVIAEPQLNQKEDKEDIETNLFLKEGKFTEGKFTEGKNSLDFKPPDNLTAKEQPAPELSVLKGQQTITNGSTPATFGQNAEILNQSKENLIQDVNSQASQTELLKNTVDEPQTTQPLQPVLESSLAKAVQLNPKALEINTNKQAISQTITPDSELSVSRIANVTEKKSSDLADQQKQPGQQPQPDKMSFPNTETGTTKNPDQTVSSGITFNVPTDTQAVNNRVESTGSSGQNAPNFTPPQDQFQIRSQIVNQALLINKENQESEMVIRLKPEHLGDLTLKVNVSNGVVNANFHSNNSEVRGLLEASLHQLKQDLANAGFKVDNVSISAGLSQFAAEQDRQLGWQRQTSKASGKNAGSGYVEGVDSQITGRTGVNYSKDDGVDYLV